MFQVVVNTQSEITAEAVKAQIEAYIPFVAGQVTILRLDTKAQPVPSEASK